MSEAPQIQSEQLELSKGWNALSQVTNCIAAYLVSEVLLTELPTGEDLILFEGIVEKITIKTGEDLKLSLETKKTGQELFSRTRSYFSN